MNVHGLARVSFIGIEEKPERFEAKDDRLGPSLTWHARYMKNKRVALVEYT
jgi:hypothetical protein